MHSRGMTFTEIARELKVDRGTVSSWAHRQSVLDNQRTGRPRSLSLAQREQLRKLKEGVVHYPTRKVVADFARLGVRISERTVRRELHYLGLRPYRMQRRPDITAAAAKRRLAFAKQYKNVNVRDLVFVDEKAYNGYWVQNRHNDVVWARDPKDVPFAKTVKFPPFQKAVLFMSRKRLSVPFFYTGKLTAAQYQQALEASGLITKPRSFSQYGNPLLVQDGDRAHTAASVSQFLEQKGVRFIPKTDWPPNSPDLNPIENLQSWLGDRVCRESPRSVAEVRRAVLSAARAAPKELLETLCDSFPARLRNVIKAKGAYTAKY